MRWVRGVDGDLMNWSEARLELSHVLNLDPPTCTERVLVLALGFTGIQVRWARLASRQGRYDGTYLM